MNFILRNLKRERSTLLISGVYMSAVTNKGSCHMYQLKRMAVPAIIQLAQQQSKEVASLTSAGGSHVAGGSQVVQPARPPSQQQPQQLALYPEPKSKSFTAHKRYALKCAFSPDSTMLATTSADQTTRLWRTSDMGLISVSVLSRIFFQQYIRRLYVFQFECFLCAK